jgi:hypothetical protein
MTMIQPATSGPPCIPPLSSYGTLTGQLFLYDGGKVAFESPITESTTARERSTAVTPHNKCILVGGLSDGLLPCPYTGLLEQACASLEGGWSLIQPVLSSSYTGFGHGSLARDCAEMESLLDYCIAHRNASTFCLVGHSTGCQNIVYFLKHARRDLQDRIRVAALQAPVSDREGVPHLDLQARNIDLALSMQSRGQAEEMMPRDAFWAPITAQRYLDLNARGGTDDFFSSDYTDEELRSRLAHVGSNRHGARLKVLVAYSGKDEYIPADLDTEELTTRLVDAMNDACREDEMQVAIPLHLPLGNHNLSQGPNDAHTFVDAVARLLADCEIN